MEVEISGGFLLLAAFLYYMDTDGLLLWVGAACVLHELGHYCALRLCGGRVTLLRLTCVGAEMRLAHGGPQGRWARMAVALAGPGVNLLLAFGAVQAGEKAYLFAGLNLGLALFNLLPVSGLDGGRALAVLLAGRRWEGLDRALSTGLSLGVTFSGLWLMGKTRNPTLLLTGSWLFVHAITGEKRSFSVKFPCNRTEGVVH
ncbi:site-2 protease family protein [Pseudoflavonifractor sp. 524-17]|uniref:metalloprotease n=1 Tax=Pseudoflavonifractor sp. 524-17 TaxID=2304577 RepID=UPI00192A1A5F|nr:site-2 protease family protein [Pseudoflavonifractor sp. 524-17]